MFGISTLNGFNFEHFRLKTSLSLFALSVSYQRRFFLTFPEMSNFRRPAAKPGIYAGLIKVNRGGKIITTGSDTRDIIDYLKKTLKK